VAPPAPRWWPMLSVPCPKRVRRQLTWGMGQRDGDVGSWEGLVFQVDSGGVYMSNTLLQTARLLRMIHFTIHYIPPSVLC